METSKKNKHVEVQFIADEEVGKEIISMKDAKIKNTGTNVNTCFRNVYSLTLIQFSVHVRHQLPIRKLQLFLKETPKL